MFHSRWLASISILVVAYVVVAVLFMHATRTEAADGWTASRDPVGLAPDPAATREAVVQVYAARALRWRGYFAVHPWIAVKRSGAQVSVFGVVGVAIGLEEGLEVNLLGLTFGIDPRSLAVKLPLIGSLGPQRLAGSAAARPPVDRPVRPGAD